MEKLLHVDIFYKLKEFYKFQALFFRNNDVIMKTQKQPKDIKSLKYSVEKLCSTAISQCRYALNMAKRASIWLENISN